MITKADYDELVRLRDHGAISAVRTQSGKAYGMIPSLGDFGYLPSSLSFDFKYIRISAAIAEYERAQEVNHE